MTPGKPVNGRVSALRLPRPARLLGGSEEPEVTPGADWWSEYGGRLDEATGEIQLPVPTFAPCPYEECPECAKGAG